MLDLTECRENGRRPNSTYGIESLKRDLEIGCLDKENPEFSRILASHLVRCLKLLICAIKDAFYYRRFEATLQKEHLRILIGWFCFVECYFVKKKYSAPEIKQILNVTVYLLSSRFVDSTSHNYGSKFSAAHSGMTQSAYFREKVISLEQLGLDFPAHSHQILRLEELAQIFSKQPKVYSLREDLLEFLRENAETVVGEVYLQQPLKNKKDLSNLIKVLSTINNNGGRYILHCILFLTSETGMWIKIRSDGKIGISPSTYDYRGFHIPVSPLPKSDIFRLLLFSDLLDGGYSRTLKTVDAYVDYHSDLFRQRLDFMRNVEAPSLLLEMEKRFSIQKGFGILDHVQELFNWSEFGLESWRRHLWYKYLVKTRAFDSANAAGRDCLREALLRRHKEVYRILFSGSLEESSGPVVYFTRSGTSANIAAMLLAEEVVGCSQTKVNITSGWYYESPAPEHWVKTDVEEANILCFSIEPSYPLPYMTKDQYIAEIRDKTRQFIARAKAESQERFVIIVDKTTDLINTDYLNRENLPENLVLIESASITKYQRGGKNYFFGSIALWGEPIEAELVEQSINASSGGMSSDVLYCLPRLRHSEIKRDIRHNQALARCLVEVLEEMQRDLDQECKWTLQIFNYTAFLVPPKIIAENSGRIGAMNSFASLSSLKGNIECFVNGADFDRTITDGFEIGDSFGLNATRLTMFASPYFKGSSQLADFLRISFGRLTSVEQMKIFARYIFKSLIDDTKYLIDRDLI